jgi:hypothetical protein
MLERKRTRTKKAAPPDAVALLAEADDNVTARRTYLATLRMRGRDIASEHGTLADAIKSEQFTAGRDGRDAEGITEQRERMAVLEQEAIDLTRTVEGAEQGLRDAESARTRVLFEHFPDFAARLDDAEPALLERRAEIEAQVATLVADEDRHRATWTELLRAVPMTKDGVSFLPKEAIGMQFSSGSSPALLLHPYARPNDPGDKLLIGFQRDPSWPEWLQDTWRRTIQPATDDTPMWQTPAGFTA